MQKNKVKENVFDNIRVVELADGIGAYTGKLFADLGAEVIRIESKEGDPTRLEKPFINDTPGIENSLRYQYLNTNKKGIVLNSTSPEGKEAFLKLISSTDLLIESLPPGYLDSIGLGYEKLASVNPKIVHTAITPYGQFGPYKDYPFSDLTTMAMGGMLYLAGIDDDKPSLAPDKQSFFQAGLFAAFSSIVALLHADLTSEGQFIDVSIQECVASALENAIQGYDLEGRVRRASGGIEAGCGTYRCQDGYVYVMVAMGRNAHLWNPFIDWLLEEQIPDAKILQGQEWLDPDYRKTITAQTTFKRIFEQFSLKYPKLTIYEESQKHKVVIYPVNSAKDVLENPQFTYRKFFKTMYSSSADATITYPGAPFFLEKVPWELRNPAPAFGQHTSEVLKQLGYSEEEIKSLVERGVSYVK